MDIKTIILLLSFIHFVQVGVLIVQFRVNKHYKGVGWWLLWTLMEAGGFLCMLFREYDIRIVIYLQNVFLFTGTLFMYVGVRVFFDRKVNFIMCWTCLGIYSVLMLFYTVVIDSASARGALICESAGVVALVTAKSLFTDRPKGLSFSANFSAIVLTIHGIFMIVIGFMKMTGIVSSNPLAPDTVNYINYLDIMLLGLLITFGFIIMLNHRLNASLADSVKELSEASNREKEQIARLEESNLEKDRYYSVLAHDLRAPFNVLIGFTHHLKDEVRAMDEEEMIKVVATINRSAENLHALVESLLEWSRMNRGATTFEPEVLNLKEEITTCLACLKDYADTKSIKLRQNLDEELNVKADRHMIETIIRNLVSNAIKFTMPGGEVIINAKMETTGNILFTINDNGIGMSRETASRVFDFDPATIRKGTSGESSSGLGLLICREFVKKHGGKIWADSNPGEGSRFCFTIPAMT